MNIIISYDEQQFLEQRIIRRFKIGSHLYGTNTAQSDTDYLCIYEPSEEELHSGLPNFHQFQYKDIEHHTDWNYCSMLQFWKNLYSGDATINADIILFTDFQPNKLEICRTYKVIRAYLGFGKRDLKDAKRNNPKKLIHAARSLYCAESLIDNVLPDVTEIQRLYKSPIEYDKMVEKEAILRAKVNELYNQSRIHNYYIAPCENPLWQKMRDANNIREFRY